jgi:hypothetical protein
MLPATASCYGAPLALAEFARSGAAVLPVAYVPSDEVSGGGTSIVVGDVARGPLTLSGAQPKT